MPFYKPLRGSKLRRGYLSNTFSPMSISGLQIWLSADRSLVTDGSASFVAASSQSLSRASNTSLQTGNVDFWVAGWAYLTDEVSGAVRTLVSKASSSPLGVEYVLGLTPDLPPNTRFTFQIFNSVFASSSVVANNYGNPSIATWIFVLAWYDSVNGTVNIKINNGATNSAVATVIPDATDASFRIGDDGFGGSYWNGRQDSVAFGKNPVGGIASLASSISSSLYNSGNGKTYGQLTASEKTNWGLISYYDFSTTSTLVTDAHGGNTLTNNNTVTCVGGKATEAAIQDGSLISQWTDLSGNNANATQSTSTARPLLKLNIQNGKPVIRFDGTDDYLTFGDLASMDVGTGNFSVYAVASNAGVANRALFAKDSIAGAGNGFLLYRSGTGGKCVWWNGSVEIDVTAGVWSDKKILGVQRAGTGANLLTTYENGTLTSTGTDARTLTNSTSAFLGSTSPGTSNLACDIAELLFFNTALSVGDRAKIVQYLNTKYGVF